MNTLYPTIIESDAIIFGTPVYWYGPTALMKGLKHHGNRVKTAAKS
jgi:multimeric flavodoxin WrbA